ncbi:hypothetical protein GALL_304280 [mine drainage metagenome]|uniref:Uncharacterized protein n=1 Tax=mine drainage metagenome TaxID=410659 RepID=A0A1J5RDK4_9ZZZZ
MLDATPPRALLALLITGRLLQWRGTRVHCESGEHYPEAVLRKVRALPPEERNALRETVRFLLSTDLRYSPFESLSHYQQQLDVAPGGAARHDD